MHFAQPLWLAAGFFFFLLVFFSLRFLHQQRQAALEKFAGNRLLGQLTVNLSGRKRTIKNGLLLLSIFCCFIALARPQYGSRWIEIKRKGIDILFALDTSKSMLTEDIKPNRLKKAKYGILDFVHQLDGDRVGLMPFAGSSFLMCPLTLDYNAFEHSLNAVTADIIPKGGTNIGEVIKAAVTTLTNNANHKILILVTDGENLQGDVLASAEEAAKKGLIIHTVGVGTPGGELIPKPKGGFFKGPDGKFVTSKLDDSTLRRIAEKSGSIYVPLGPSGEGLQTIYRKKLALVPREELAERRQKIPKERFQFPLAAALLFLICEFLVTERKTVHLPAKHFLNRFRTGRKKKKGLFIFLFFSLLLFHGSAGNSYGSTGETAYKKVDYVAASEYYRKELKKNPKNEKLHYNFATAAYKNNMFDDAISSFSKSLESSDINLQQKAYYNLGNAYYMKGLQQQKSDKTQAISQWKHALESLDSALKLNPDDKDARYNRDLIKKQLEKLQKQKQKQNKQSREKQKGKNEKKKKKQPENNKNSQTGQKKKNSPQVAETGKPTEKAAAEKKAMERENRERRRLGKMTREEAERLLNSLKNREGELNFVPSDQHMNNDSIERNW